MADLVSVIVPVYKVEPYLFRCVHSVMNQSYQNMEIILIDDGSPDNCGKICDELAQKDDRITVYHKENGGLSDARNYGVERSSGKYIAFIDSDDYIAEDYIEYLYGLLAENDADISACPMNKTSGDIAECNIDEKLPELTLLSGKEACFKLFDSLYLVLVTAWGKLYKSEIVKKYPFPKGRIHEDEATTCKYYYESQRVAVGNKCFYAYFQNPNGIMKSNPNELKTDKIWALEHKARFFEEQNEKDVAKEAWKFYFEFCTSDSIRNNGRCDVYLKNFARGKTLDKKLIVKYRIYKLSKTLYKLYVKCEGMLLKLRAKISKRENKDKHERKKS